MRVIFNFLCNCRGVSAFCRNTVCNLKNKCFPVWLSLEFGCSIFCIHMRIFTELVGFLVTTVSINIPFSPSLSDMLWKRYFSIFLLKNRKQMWHQLLMPGEEQVSHTFLAGVFTRPCSLVRYYIMSDLSWIHHLWHDQKRCFYAIILFM